MTTMVRFFVVGDIGEPGQWRSAVADAMSAMQNDGLGATFVLTTGDNSYKSAGFNDDSFTTLKQEMISKVQLPWFLCLGNHDVTDSGWEWHVKHAQHDSATDTNARRLEQAAITIGKVYAPIKTRDLDPWGKEEGEEAHLRMPSSRSRMSSSLPSSLLGKKNKEHIFASMVRQHDSFTDNQCHCPAPAYTLPNEITGDFLTIMVINTNKLKKGRPRSATAPAPEFYTSTSDKWWSEQKDSLSNALSHAKEAGRWRVVVGHHPAEYALHGEHRIPGIRYFSSTYMRGGIASLNANPRWGLAHILRRQADWYLCGHQHLMAYMRLCPSKSRPVEETHCNFAIIGNSSKTEQDLGDFDDDSPSPTSESSKLERVADLLFGPSCKGADQNKRYAEEWTDTDNVGFAVADVTSTQFRMSYYSVPKGQREAVLAYEVVTERKIGTASAHTATDESCQLEKAAITIGRVYAPIKTRDLDPWGPTVGAEEEEELQEEEDEVHLPVSINIPFT